MSEKSEGKGRETHIDLLQGIPYLKERARSRLKSRYRDETEKIDTELQKFVDNGACCTEDRNRSTRNALKRVS